MSRDQFDAVHADFQFHSYVTPVHCRNTSRYTEDICRNVFGCCHLRPDVKEPVISLDEETSVRFWCPVHLWFPFCHEAGTTRFVTQYIRKHTFSPSKYGVINQQLTNILDVVGFLLGNSLASEFYMPTFRNTLFYLHRQVGMKYECFIPTRL